MRQHKKEIERTGEAQMEAESFHGLCLCECYVPARSAFIINFHALRRPLFL